MAQVLMVDDDLGAIDTFGRIIRSAGHGFLAETTVQRAVELATVCEPDIALVDLLLTDGSGLQIIRLLRRSVPHAECIVITGYPSFEFARDALRAGACEWLEKPVFEDQLLQAVDRVLARQSHSRPTPSASPDIELHGALRVAEIIVAFVHSPLDKPTLFLLGRELGHASGCLRNWCRTMNVQARDVRDFARALRAVARIETDPAAREVNLLDIVDRRTLKKFCERSGGTGEHLPRTIKELLERQQFIKDKDLLSVVRRRLQRDS